METVEIFSAYKRPPKVVVICGESKTVQSERDSCDINVIVRKYAKTGVLPVDAREAVYMDVTQIGDYRTMLHQVEMAKGVFAQLPAAARARFDNDVGAFLDFAQDPANEGELVELGLLPRSPAVVEGPKDGPESAPAGA